MPTTGDTRQHPTSGCILIAITGSQRHTQLQQVAPGQPVNQREE